jgi:hypothetical protein
MHLFLICASTLAECPIKNRTALLIGSPAIIAMDRALTRDFATHPLEMVCP